MLENERLSEETEYFEKIKDFIKSDTVRLEEIIQRNNELVRKQGRKFNEDNPIGGMYSKMELTEIHYEIENELVRSEEAKNEIYFYKKLIKEPYFARIDFTPDRTKKLQKVYIGLKTLQNPQTYQTYVCDWRAPVSSLFYEDFTDKAYFDAPAGRIEGDLNLKRQFKFQDGELKYFVDSDLKIDDDILRDVLSNQKSSGGLKVIVNSIQREQNKAIRFNENKNLCVLGPAGSGKTSVGFHRLAYLLYRNRKELTSSEIVMFSNNDIFSSYVADVIPELGETPVNYASFYSVFNAEIPGYRICDYYELADELIRGSDIRKLSVEIKYGKEFETAIQNAAEDFVPEFKPVEFYDEVILSGEELLERYLSEKEILPHLRCERLIEFANGKTDVYFTVHKDEIFVKVEEESEIDEDTGKIIIRDRRLLKQETANMIRGALDFKPENLYLDTLKKYVEENGLDSGIYDISLQNKEQRKLLFEDALCIVRLKQFLGTAAVIPSVKHILIDEAQDMCLLQHKIIKTMFPKAICTLLADSNQAILPDINTADTEALKKIYKAEEIKLNKSYRSTAQINKLAVSLLPKENVYEIFERDGEAVKYSGDIKTCLAEFKDKSESVTIITKTAEEAKMLFDGLKHDFPELCLCDNKSAEYSGKPCIMNLSLTKGLEFDSVIVYNKNGEFDGDGNKRFLYMAVTRALHRLCICGM